MEEKVTKEPKEKKQPKQVDAAQKEVPPEDPWTGLAERGVQLKSVTFASQTHNPLQTGYAHLKATDNRVDSITFIEGSHIEIRFLKERLQEVCGVSLAAVIGFVFDRTN